MSRERILVATDLSESADEAVRQAHERAAAGDAELVVCHVVPSLLRSEMLFPQLQQRVAEIPARRAQVEDAVSRRVVELTGRAPRDFGVIVDEGLPAEAIVRQSEACRADLVVVGNRGATGLARLVLGGVAEQVVRHAHGPVLVARPRAGSGLVLAATDFSDPSLPALAAGAAEARRLGARLAAVHSLPFSVPPVGLVGAAFGGVWIPLTEEDRRRMVQSAKERLEAALQSVNAEGEPVVLEGDPAPAIVRAAEERGAELVVVGTIGRSGLRRMLLGSVADRVVRLAPGPVLVVRLARP